MNINEKNLNKPDVKDIFYAQIMLLSKGHVNFDCPIPVSWMSRELSRLNYDLYPIGGYLFLNVKPCGDGYLAKGKATATLSTFCGTCLKKMTLHISTIINSWFVKKNQAPDFSHKDTMMLDDLQVEYFSGERIVFDNLISDELVLEFPIIPKCNESCGIPVDHDFITTCNMDPRFAVLKNFNLIKEK